MTELVGCVLTIVVCNHYAAHHEAAAHEFIAQAQYILIVGDAEVGTYLVFLDVLSANHDNNLYAVAQLGQHAQLAVGLETWQYTRCMVVVKQFATQLHIKFAIELCDALLDMLRLNLEIFVVIETDFHNYSVMLGSSRPIPFFLSTTFSTKPRMRAATPSDASITSGAV